MKLLIIGNTKEKLSNILSNYYEIELFNINDLNDLEDKTKLINRINKENKSYIIEGIVDNSINFIYNLVDTIIILDYKFDKNNYLDILIKYSNKLIIIKNKKDLKKYLNSVYKNGSYIE